ncbi:MAG TPA: hypothetical protein VFH03_04625, partial [Actinoplanes sp.]|nr:hypothetical protein [Actinoplanes sp.]
PSAAPPSAAPPSAAPPCHPRVSTGPRPEWARAGFSDDGSGIPHVMSRGGDILGVLFGGELNAPPAAGRNNKILWVARVPGRPGESLEITAIRDGTSEPVRRTVAGRPGPSIVDLPAAGCWRLALTWSGHTDTMDLVYRPPAPPTVAGGIGASSDGSPPRRTGTVTGPCRWC